MMALGKTTPAFDRLVEQLAKLPGIGKRSAERIAFYMLKQPVEDAMELTRAIDDMKKNVLHCTQCFNLSESDLCPICSDHARDQGLIMVIEQPSDAMPLETTGMYRGVYHVLMGAIAPLDDVGPGELNIHTLLTRVKSGSVHEVILATNPTLEGDGTALYLSQELDKTGVKISRLARGMPTGSQLEMLSKAVLADAIEGRQQMG